MDVVKLLNPHLLSVSELTAILKKHGVVYNLNNYDKDKLIDLFKVVAMPLPQREHSNTTGGRLLLNKQLEKNNTTEKLSSLSAVKQLTSAKTSCSNNKLKAPLMSKIDSSKKTIKLNATKRKSTDLDSIIINKRKNVENESKTPITSIPSEQSNVFSKTIKLTSVKSNCGSGLDNIIIKRKCVDVKNENKKIEKLLKEDTKDYCRTVTKKVKEENKKNVKLNILTTIKETIRSNDKPKKHERITAPVTLTNSHRSANNLKKAISQHLDSKNLNFNIKHSRHSPVKFN